MIHAGRFAALRAAPELEMLPVALLSTLLFRTQSETPDAILIAAGESFLTSVRHRRAFEEVFEETPTVLLGGAGVVRRFRLHSRWVDPDQQPCGSPCGKNFAHLYRWRAQRRGADRRRSG